MRVHVAPVFPCRIGVWRNAKSTRIGRPQPVSTIESFTGNLILSFESSATDAGTATTATVASGGGTRDALMDRISVVRSKLNEVIRDKSAVVDAVLTAILADGSVLLEDVPGVGKTTLAKAVAALIDLRFARIQCTPDLLPADILGGSIYQPANGTFEFRRGPVFCNLLIADEINRASPRTQSALLEAMAESQVTVDGSHYDLESPFVVIATQNPTGFEGTFPLPESQLDRFLMRLAMDYPDEDSEIELLLQQQTSEPVDQLTPVMGREDLVAIQQQVTRTPVDRKVVGYLVDITTATRRDSRLRVGCSPRGSKMLLRAAQARAVLHGRDFVLPDDVADLAGDVLSHRLVSRSVTSSTADMHAVISDIVSDVNVPV